MSKYFYYEPRTGTVYAKQPERRNVYKIEDTPENRAGLEAAQAGSNEFLLAWLRDNEVREEPEPFEDRDWADLREAHGDLKEKLKNRSAYVDELSADAETNKALNELLDDADALVELVGKLVL